MKSSSGLDKKDKINIEKINIQLIFKLSKESNRLHEIMKKELNYDKNYLRE